MMIMRITGRRIKRRMTMKRTMKGRTLHQLKTLNLRHRHSPNKGQSSRSNSPKAGVNFGPRRPLLTRMSCNADC